MPLLSKSNPMIFCPDPPADSPWPWPCLWSPRKAWLRSPAKKYSLSLSGGDIIDPADRIGDAWSIKGFGSWRLDPSAAHFHFLHQKSSLAWRAELLSASSSWRRAITSCSSSLREKQRWWSRIISSFLMASSIRDICLLGRFRIGLLAHYLMTNG